MAPPNKALMVHELAELARTTLKKLDDLAPEAPDDPIDEGARRPLEATLLRIGERFGFAAVRYGEITGEIPEGIREELRFAVHPEGMLVEWVPPALPLQSCLVEWENLVSQYLVDGAESAH